MEKKKKGKRQLYKVGMEKRNIRKDTEINIERPYQLIAWQLTYV